LASSDRLQLALADALHQLFAAVAELLEAGPQEVGVGAGHRVGVDHIARRAVHQHLLVGVLGVDSRVAMKRVPM
jgi:hypothetical protein